MKQLATYRTVQLLGSSSLRLSAETMLAGQGISAEIEDIDLNLFTGQLAVINARGEGEQGTGFDIAQLRLNMDYWPLFSRQIQLAYLELRDSRAGVKVDKDGNINVAGFAIPADSEEKPEEEEDTTPWSIGLERAEIGAVRIRYQQPGFDREITLSSSTRGVDTANADNAFPVDMQVAVEDSRIAVVGKVKPFGERITGDFKLTIADFDLDLIAPLAEQADIARLAGMINGEQDINLDYHADEGLKLGVDGGLAVAGAALVMPAIRLANADLDWQGQANMVPGETAPSLHTKSELKTEGTVVRAPASGLDLEQQSLTWDGAADYAPGDPTVVRTDGNLAAEGLKLTLAEQNMTVTGERIAFSGQAGLDPDAEGIPADTPLPLKMNARLDASGIEVTDTAMGRRLAGLDTFAARKINISGLADIGIATITADGIKALARAADAPRIEAHPNILQVANLTIEQTAVSEQARVNIGAVTVTGIDGLLYRPADGPWELDRWFDSGAETTKPGSATQAAADDTTVAESPTPGDDAELEFVLGAGYIRQSSMAVEDRDVTPTFTSQLSDLNMTVADLDTRKPTRGSSLKLYTEVGRYGSIKAQGTIKPFLEPPSADITGRIEAVDLGSASGYVDQAIDRRIDRGTFSADLDFDLKRGDIDAEAGLRFSKLRIGGAQNASGAVEDKLGLPLDKILSLLRDGDGNIRLQLPVGGDLEKPTFSIYDIVRKAVFKGLQAAVLSVYSPLGILKLGKGLVDLAAATRFEPLLFEPGNSQLNAADRQLLDKTVELLNNRPESDVIVCGHAVPADRDALGLPPVADGDRPGTDGSEQAASANPDVDASDRLLQLASARGDAVGDYLVEQGIAAKRFVLCNPALGEPDDAEPRTVISF